MNKTKNDHTFYDAALRERQLKSLKALAGAALENLPQYRDYHSGPEWQVFIAKKNLRTGIGLTAVKGEFLLGKEIESGNRVLFFSLRTLVHTSFSSECFGMLE